jgi:hypothetical protein
VPAAAACCRHATSVQRVSVPQRGSARLLYLANDREHVSGVTVRIGLSTQLIVDLTQPSNLLEGRHTHECFTIPLCHALDHIGLATAEKWLSVCTG